MRVADLTAFFGVGISHGGRTGYLVEMEETAQIFEAPREQLTKRYVKGRVQLTAASGRQSDLRLRFVAAEVRVAVLRGGHCIIKTEMPRQFAAAQK